MKQQGRDLVVLLAVALTVMPGVLAGCQSSGGGESAAASRIARQIATSSPLYIRGEYQTHYGNESWIETLPESAASMGLPARAGCDYMKNWLHMHGGIDSGWSDITIVLRARRKVNVVVTAAESVVIRRYSTPTAPYTLTCVPDNGSWVEQEESLNWANYSPGFILDDDHYLGTPWQPAHYQLSDNTFKMEPGAEQYELLTGYTSRCNCAWAVELYLTINGSPEHVLVENGKEPFRTETGPAYPNDTARNAVWCAISNHPRLVAPNAAYCPPPTTYEQVPVF